MTDTTSMLEKCARAICLAEPNRHARGEWDATPDYTDEAAEEVRSKYLGYARACIQALMQPSMQARRSASGMFYEHDAFVGLTSVERAEKVWRAMLTAILEGK